MSATNRKPAIVEKGHVLRLRLEQPKDAVFLWRLFCDARRDRFDAFDPVLVETLLRQQMAGQAMTYATRYPAARYDIVELDGCPIGRVVTDRTIQAITLVDIALSADRRDRGLGTQLLCTLMEEADIDGLPLRLSVDPSNFGAVRLYSRLGFVVVTETAMTLIMERVPVKI